jgi:Tfp pilus assembly protein PilF
MIFEADNKNDDIILLIRPELYQNSGNTTEAISRLEEIIADRPDNYYAWERLLLLYSETKNWEKLFEAGKNCASKFNRSFLAKVLYANGAIETGQLSIAEEELKKARILAGDQKDMIIQVLVMEADLYYRKKEYKKSFETFGEALKSKPDDAMILNNYAYYLAEQGLNLKEAERMSRIVITKEKGNATYLDTYAWILYKIGKYREAQKIMEEIINGGKSQDAEWYEHMGYIMKAQKRCDKAVENWKTAFKLDKRKDGLLKEIENCVMH